MCKFERNFFFARNQKFSGGRILKGIFFSRKSLKMAKTRLGTSFGEKIFSSKIENSQRATNGKKKFFFSIKSLKMTKKNILASLVEVFFCLTPCALDSSLQAINKQNITKSQHNKKTFFSPNYLLAPSTLCRAARHAASAMIRCRDRRPIVSQFLFPFTLVCFTCFSGRFPLTQLFFKINLK